MDNSKIQRRQAGAEGPSEPEAGGASPFLVAVITRPDFFPGEAACLEGMLAAGLEKLHLRKPGAGEEGLEALLKQIDPRWYSRMVLHGNRELWPLAARYGIPQMHCPPGALEALKQGSWRPGTGRLEDPAVRLEDPAVSREELAVRLEDPVGSREDSPGDPTVSRLTRSGEGSPIALSASLHSWEEIKEVGGAGLTYVFMSPVFNSISKPGYAATPGLLRRPAGPFPCKVIGLGGVDKDSIGELIREGWDGAAVLGWIWKDPGMAVKRYEQLIETIKNNLV